MKKYLFILFALVVAVSCNDEKFLEEHSYTDDTGSFFTSQSSMEIALASAYSNIQYMVFGNQRGGSEHNWMLNGMGLDSFGMTGNNAQFSNWELLTSDSGYARHYGDYMYKLANRANTVKRIDSDYKRYYLNEPLSQEILTMPLIKIRKLDIETWGYTLIKAHDMSKKQFFNMTTILKQVLDYYSDLGYGRGNPFNQVHFRPNAFRRVVKKTADTQIFYPDEVKAICDLAYERAKTTGDESWLAIPLLKCLGLRISECLGLSFDDFDRSTNLVNIHRSFAVIDCLGNDGCWNTRRYQVTEYLKQNAPPRTILASDECFDIVDKIRKILKAKDIEREYLFDVQTPNNIEMKLYHLCDELKIERRSPHKLRKTYVSHLLNNGFDQDFVREQVGHQMLQTTLNYYVYSTTRNTQQIERLNKVL